jgi:outer membrane protein assembly factor BamB
MPTKSSRPARRGPYIRTTTQGRPQIKLKSEATQSPLKNRTLGELSIAVRVSGAARFDRSVLVIPVTPQELVGVDPTTVRVFRWDEKEQAARPIWNSGINLGMGFVWAFVGRAGTYVPIGLPRDRVLTSALRHLAEERRTWDDASPEEFRKWMRDALGLLLDAPEEDVEELRRLVATIELQTAPHGFLPGDLRIGGDAQIEPVPLPGGVTLKEFRKRFANLDTLPGGLPEETLFFRPGPDPLPEPPWPIPFPQPEKWPGIDPGILDWLRIRKHLLWPPRWLCWFFSRNWWTYHHDAQLTGVASGCSGIRRTTVSGLTLQSSIALDGPVISIPSVVHGKIYVGTGNSSTAASGSGGTLYKIDLSSGTIDATFTFNTPVGQGSRQGYAGIGSSPAVTGGRVYFSGLDGKLYCLDASTLALIWTTNLRNTDPGKNQPVNHSARAEGWSGPLVVNNRVYVGFGEGESDTFGFVYCLDALSGAVIWLFCTNKFTGVTDNSPNVIPASLVSGPLPAGFTSAPDPPERGASPWSSCAYHSGLNRVYIGTGNAIPDTALPDPKYASGVISLDASSGAFAGFFQPLPSDSYKLTDNDVDVPAGPTIFWRGLTQVLGIGSKGGSFFLLDPSTMGVLARRQLLPYDSSGNPFLAIDPGAGENMYGVMGTATVHRGLGRLFIGLGGYGGAIDINTTPFMRAVDWTTLADAWTTAGTNPPKYTVPVPPMYTNPGETGLSSPAVVNDVVFISTSKPAMYCLDAATGACLWLAPGIGAGSYAMGPAIYGNYVVVGIGGYGSAAGRLNIYAL